MINLIHLFLIFTAFSQVKSTSRKTTDDCSLMFFVINEIRKEDDHKILYIQKEYLSWNPIVELDFNILDTTDIYRFLPKTPEDREARLATDVMDPYPSFFVYAYPFTDTIFSQQDKEHIKLQAIDRSVLSIGCNIGSNIFVNKNRKVKNCYAFYKPLYSVDGTYAILRYSSDFEFYSPKDFTRFGILQTKYYKRDQKGSWSEIFHTGKWIIG